MLTAEGKAQLALEIRDQAGRALGLPPAPPAALQDAAPAASKAAAKPGRNVRQNPIRGVLFSQFIVQ